MRKLSGFIIVVLIIFLGRVSWVHAQTSSLWPFRGSERVVLEADEVVNHDFFAAGESVEIKGTVNGDLYAAGGNISIEGTVQGDVLAAGGNIEIPGTVGGDVRTAGGTIGIKGKVGKNLTAGGGNIETDKAASISGSMVVGGGNVVVNGPIGGNMVAGAGNLIVRNRVGGNIYTGVGKLQMDREAVVNGDVVYWSEEKATVDPAASVAGTLEQREVPDYARKTQEEKARSAASGFRVFSLLSMLAIGLLILKFLPGVLENGAALLDQKPWQSLGFGFLKLILTPIAAIILFITVIGFPIGIFLIFAYITALYLSSYIVAYWTGKLIMSKFNQQANRYWIFVVGALVYILVTSVPVFGGLVKFLALLFGLGVILLLEWSWYQKVFKKK